MSIQKTMRALADPIRREILEMLKGGRRSAGEIAEHFPVTGASVSRHLSVLKEADLIRDTREGKFIYYDLNYADRTLVEKAEKNKHCSWSLDGMDMLERQAEMALNWWKE